MFDWIIKLFEHSDPSKRIEALKCLGKLKIMTSSSMVAFIKILSDPYENVRLQAVRTACIISTNHRNLIDKLLELVDDNAWRIRAYAVKALGISGCQSLKLKETLAWLLAHESHPHVKTEAIKACRFVIRQSSECTNIKDYLMVIFQSESTNETVRKEAGISLASIGIPANGNAKKTTDSSFELLSTSMSSSRSDGIASTTPARRRSSVMTTKRKSVSVKPGLLDQIPSKLISNPSNVRKFSRNRLKTHLDVPADEPITETTPSESQEFVVSSVPVAPIVKDDAVMNPIGLYANFTAEEIEVISSSDIITQSSINMVIEQVHTLRL